MIKPSSASAEEELEPEFEPPHVGSASVGEEPETPPDPSRVGRAHYAGMSEDKAARVFHEECICVTCYISGMCKVATGISESLTVVSRCLAYLPPEG